MPDKSASALVDSPFRRASSTKAPSAARCDQREGDWRNFLMSQPPLQKRALFTWGSEHDRGGKQKDLVNRKEAGIQLVKNAQETATGQ